MYNKYICIYFYKLLVTPFLNTNDTQFITNYPILKEKFYLSQENGQISAPSTVTTMVYTIFQKSRSHLMP